MDEARIVELVDQFTTSNHYISESWKKNVLKEVTVEKDGEPVSEELAEESRAEFLKQKMDAIRQRRINIGKALLRGLHFVNKNGQPLRMMPLLKLDPELLEQPLYH